MQQFRFNSRKRQESETIANYVAELRRLAEFCNYGDALNKMLRDRLVWGVRDKYIQKKLLADSHWLRLYGSLSVQKLRRRTFVRWKQRPQRKCALRQEAAPTAECAQQWSWELHSMWQKRTPQCWLSIQEICVQRMPLLGTLTANVTISQWEPQPKQDTSQWEEAQGWCETSGGIRGIRNRSWWSLASGTSWRDPQALSTSNQGTCPCWWGECVYGVRYWHLCINSVRKSIQTVVAREDPRHISDKITDLFKGTSSSTGQP